MKLKIYLVLWLAMLSGNKLVAQEHHHEESKAGHSHAKAAMHGGEVVMTIAHHFEVVWMPDHVMVYLYDRNQNPLVAKDVTGEVVFQFKDGKEYKATLNLMEAGKMQMMSEHHAEGGQHEMMHGKTSKEEMEAMHKRMSNQDHLVANVNLENANEGEVKATFTLKGLINKDESEATFASKYKKMNMLQHESQKHE